jgi:hypothetical protein
MANLTAGNTLAYIIFLKACVARPKSHLAGAEGSVGVLLVAASTAAALSRENPLAGRVADVDGAVRARGSVLVSAGELAGVAGLGGNGEEAEGSESVGEVHDCRRVGC